MLEESYIARFAGTVLAVNNSDITITKIKWLSRGQLVHPYNFFDGTQTYFFIVLRIKNSIRNATINIREFIIGFLLAQHCQIRNSGIIQIFTVYQMFCCDLQPLRPFG